MRKSHYLGAVCACVLNLFTLTASAGTFGVISGAFDVYDPSNNYVGGVPLVGNGVLVEGLFDGSASAIATDSSATYAGFDTALFLGEPLYLYFAQTGLDGNTHSAPTIDFNSMTADMNSIYANWNSLPPGYIGEFNVGGLANVIELSPFEWQLSWTHTQLEGAFEGMTSVMTMNISQVPIPAAAWLFGSGLLGLVGIATRKKA